ncbi:hypothetical protein ACG93R_00755 [Acinetobacter guillouiae]|uniref:hypothetical protein n=1 Tax=Acinetobacter guillouiae TaxID=106649 RepID=UPI003AF728F6
MNDIIRSPNGQFPEDVELCNYTSLTCNPILKVGNYYIAAPYNFFFDSWYWEQAQKVNKLEALLAVRFGLEYDINKLGDGMISKLSFNTQMYIKFSQYVKKHAKKEAFQIIHEFEKTAFSLKVKTGFSPTDVMLILGIKKALSTPQVIVDAKALADNNFCPLYINRQTFNQIFKTDYHAGMLKQLTNDRTYRGEGPLTPFPSNRY